MSIFGLSTKVSEQSAPKDLVTHATLGRTKDEEEVSGSINVPEVAHDTEPEDYVVRDMFCRAYVSQNADSGCYSLTLTSTPNRKRSKQSRI